MNSIVILKMLNGDEIVGKYVNEDTDNYFIDTPLLVQAVYDEYSGNTKIVLISYMPFALVCELGMPFSKRVVAQCLPVKPSVETYYNNSLEFLSKNKDTGFDHKLEEVNASLEETLDDMFPNVYKNISKAIH